jgi:hypothetical protein
VARSSAACASAFDGSRSASSFAVATRSCKVPHYPKCMTGERTVPGNNFAG